MEYHIEERAHVDMRAGGREIALDFEPGAHAAKTPDEAAALEVLAAQGIAVPVTRKPPKPKES